MVDDTRHVVEFRDSGWSMQHPLACRPNLLDCEIHSVVSHDMDKATGPPAPLGRYYVRIEEGEPVYTSVPADSKDAE